jgi:diguanylate cyclase (GGDEF)-like protein
MKTSMESHPLPPKSLLIADYDQSTLTPLCALLQSSYTLHLATNGPQALQLAQTQPRPDLILLDIPLPGMDGFTVCRLIKENPATRHIPVIFLTSPGHAVDEEQCLHLGAVDCFRKPLTPALTKTRIRNHLALKQQGDRLEALNALDGLTGLPNRRRFDAFIDHEWRRAIRAQSPISLMLMDVDDFTSYNDHYGHPAGDECLRRLADMLNTMARRSIDLLARYDNRTFAWVLPETDPQGAIQVAESVLEATRLLRIPHDYATASRWVTLSIGVAYTIPTPSDTLDTFIQTTDDNLYQAKSTGRNRFFY